MKHAGTVALGTITPLLLKLRSRPGLKERSLGVFYHKSQAFLHFHEDPAGLFADLREGESFARYPLQSPGDEKRLLERVDASLDARLKIRPTAT